MPKLVIFDTNFLLVPGQFGVDVIGELTAFWMLNLK